MKTIDELSVSMHGPMREFIVDCAGGIVATTCDNTMITMGGGTPCDALCGRFPKMPPSTDQIESPGKVTRLKLGLISRTQST